MIDTFAVALVNFQDNDGSRFVEIEIADFIKGSNRWTRVEIPPSMFDLTLAETTGFQITDFAFQGQNVNTGTIYLDEIYLATP